MLPDFILIGAQKAGTTSLCSHLFAHPNVMHARRKEVHYFDSPEFALGLNWYRAHFPLAIHRLSNSGCITGEATPYYLTHPQVPARVAAVVPKVKLIVMLRNPIDRALSHHNHQVRRGREPLDFEQAIRAEPQRLSGELERMQADDTYYSHAYWAYSYLTRGRYAEQLERWLQVFPLDQLLVIGSEAFFNDPRTQYKRTLTFLGLPDHDLGEYKKQNTGGAYDGITPELHAELNAYFRPHNERLYALVGRDFGWNDPP